jgi:hypothetical protein
MPSWTPLKSRIGEKWADGYLQACETQRFTGNCATPSKFVRLLATRAPFRTNCTAGSRLLPDEPEADPDVITGEILTRARKWEEAGGRRSQQASWGIQPEVEAHPATATLSVLGKPRSMRLVCTESSRASRPRSIARTAASCGFRPSRSSRSSSSTADFISRTRLPSR